MLVLFPASSVPFVQHSPPRTIQIKESEESYDMCDDESATSNTDDVSTDNNNNNNNDKDKNNNQTKPITPTFEDRAELARVRTFLVDLIDQQAKAVTKESKDMNYTQIKKELKKSFKSNFRHKFKSQIKQIVDDELIKQLNECKNNNKNNNKNNHNKDDDKKETNDNNNDKENNENNINNKNNLNNNDSKNDRDKQLDQQQKEAEAAQEQAAQHLITTLDNSNAKLNDCIQEIKQHTQKHFQQQASSKNSDDNNNNNNDKNDADLSKNGSSIADDSTQISHQNSDADNVNDSETAETVQAAQIRNDNDHKNQTEPVQIINDKNQKNHDNAAEHQTEISHQNTDDDNDNPPVKRSECFRDLENLRAQLHDSETAETVQSSESDSDQDAALSDSSTLVISEPNNKHSPSNVNDDDIDSDGKGIHYDHSDDSSSDDENKEKSSEKNKNKNEHAINIDLTDEKKQTDAFQRFEVDYQDQHLHLVKPVALIVGALIRVNRVATKMVQPKSPTLHHLLAVLHFTNQMSLKSGGYPIVPPVINGTLFNALSTTVQSSKRVWFQAFACCGSVTHAFSEAVDILKGMRVPSASPFGLTTMELLARFDARLSHGKLVESACKYFNKHYLQSQQPNSLRQSDIDICKSQWLEPLRNCTHGSLPLPVLFLQVMTETYSHQHKRTVTVNIWRVTLQRFNRGYITFEQSFDTKVPGCIHAVQMNFLRVYDANYGSNVASSLFFPIREAAEKISDCLFSDAFDGNYTRTIFDWCDLEMKNPSSLLYPVFNDMTALVKAGDINQHKYIMPRVKSECHRPGDIITFTPITGLCCVNINPDGSSLGRMEVYPDNKAQPPPYFVAVLVERLLVRGGAWGVSVLIYAHGIVLRVPFHVSLGRGAFVVSKSMVSTKCDKLKQYGQPLPNQFITANLLNQILDCAMAAVDKHTADTIPVASAPTAAALGIGNESSSSGTHNAFVRKSKKFGSPRTMTTDTPASNLRTRTTADVSNSATSKAGPPTTSSGKKRKSASSKKKSSNGKKKKQNASRNAKSKVKKEIDVNDAETEDEEIVISDQEEAEVDDEEEETQRTRRHEWACPNDCGSVFATKKKCEQHIKKCDEKLSSQQTNDKQSKKKNNSSIIKSENAPNQNTSQTQLFTAADDQQLSPQQMTIHDFARRRTLEEIEKKNFTYQYKDALHEYLVLSGVDTKLISIVDPSADSKLELPSTTSSDSGTKKRQAPDHGAPSPSKKQKEETTNEKQKSQKKKTSKKEKSFDKLKIKKEIIAISSSSNEDDVSDSATSSTDDEKVAKQKHKRRSSRKSKSKRPGAVGRGGAFILFLQAVRDNIASRFQLDGNDHPTQKEIAQVASEEWAELSPQEKESYNILNNQIIERKKAQLLEQASKTTVEQPTSITLSPPRRSSSNLVQSSPATHNLFTSTQSSLSTQVSSNPSTQLPNDATFASMFQQFLMQQQPQPQHQQRHQQQLQHQHQQQQQPPQSNDWEEMIRLKCQTFFAEMVQSGKLSQQVESNSQLDVNYGLQNSDYDDVEQRTIPQSLNHTRNQQQTIRNAPYPAPGNVRPQAGSLLTVPRHSTAQQSAASRHLNRPPLHNVPSPNPQHQRAQQQMQEHQQQQLIHQRITVQRPPAASTAHLSPIVDSDEVVDNSFPSNRAPGHYISQATSQPSLDQMPQLSPTIPTFSSGSQDDWRPPHDSYH